MLKPSTFRSKPPASFESLEARRLLSAVAAGLTGEYFDGGNFQTPVLTRTDPTVNFDLTKTPDPEITSPYSVRWTGQVEATKTQAYTFTVQSNGGVRLWVNGTLIIDKFSNDSESSSSGNISLVAGTKYDIRLDYAANTGASADVELLWSGPHMSETVIPAADLFADDSVALPSGAGVTGEYFEGRHFNEQVMTRIDPDINYNFGAGVPDSVLDADEPFSIRWKGHITPAYSQTYTFSAIADDGVRVWVDGQRIINDFTDHVARRTSGSIALEAGEDYNIRVDYYEDHGVASVKLSWHSASQPDEVVPAGALTHGTISLATPAGVGASATGNDITVNWDAVPDATGYIIQRSPDGSSDWAQVGTTSGALTFEQTGLPDGTQYFYRVIATIGSDQSDPSSVVNATTVSTAPTDLVASVVSDTEIGLTWNDVTGENGFVIQQSANGSTGWADVTTVGTGTTSYTVAALTASTTYYFRVFATSSAGTSAASNVANATTTGPIPAFASETSVYGLDTSSNVDLINTSTGAITSIGSTLFVTDAAGRDPVTGNFYYVEAGTSTPEVAVWDPSNNTNTVLNDGISLTGAVARAAFDSAGHFYITAGNGDLYQLDRTTGDATLLGTITTGGDALPSSGGDIAFAPDGTLYLATNGILYTVDLSTLDATEIGDTGVGNVQIAFGQDGVLYAGNGANLYSVSLSDATATLIGASGDFGDMASVPLYADLSVDQSAVLSTVSGVTTCTYTITSSSAGPNATTGPVTITDTLPTGVTYVNATGTGWIFNVSGSTLTMTYSASVAANTSLPTVTLAVSVNQGAPGPLTNALSITSTIFDGNTSNNTSSLNTNLT